MPELNAGEIGVLINNQFMINPEPIRYIANPFDQPIPVPPQPIDPPDFTWFYSDNPEEFVDVPGWTKFVTQNKKGTIECWEIEPIEAASVWVGRGGRHKTVVRTPEYEMQCTHV